MGSTEMGRPPLMPIIGSIIILLGWLVFILFYALYWSNDFSVFQNIIVTIVSLAITALLIGLLWIVWGAMHSWKFGNWEMR